MRRLYVLDFDRTLADTDAMFERLIAISHETTDQLNHAIEASNDAFDLMRFLGHYHDEGSIKDIIERFTSTTRREQSAFLLPGAQPLIEFIKSISSDMIILTFGSEIWQTAKLEAAGLGRELDYIITASPEKAKIIEGWREADGFHLDIGHRTEIYDEVILVDDKATAFSGIGQNVLGYWVQSGEPLPVQAGTVDALKVSHVDTLHDVIEVERVRVVSAD